MDDLNCGSSLASGVTERKMNEHTLHARQEHLVRRAKLLEWGMAHGESFPSDVRSPHLFHIQALTITVLYQSLSIPTKYDFANNEGLRRHCCCLRALPRLFSFAGADNIGILPVNHDLYSIL